MKKILIVEDDFRLQKALSFKLRKEGFEVYNATNGKEGLNMVETNKPDLILLDIAMPMMDGVEMLKILKKEKKINIPVIILTNLTEYEKTEKLTKEGAYEYIIKSDISIEEMINYVKKILNY